MLKKIVLLSLVLGLLVGLASFGNEAAKAKGKLAYSVDAASTHPTATVVKRGGQVVVIFKVTQLAAGNTFSFKLDATPSKVKGVTFPVTGLPSVSGKDLGKFTVVFAPASVIFTSATTKAETTLTMTLAAGDYSKTKKLKTEAIITPTAGSGLKPGEAVKITIIKKKAAVSALTPEQQILQDIQDALAPETDEVLAD